LGPANPRSLKCGAVVGWLTALQAPAAQRGDAVAHWRTALGPALQALPPQHAFRAEMLAAEAELLRASDQATPASARLAEARALYLQAVGQPLPDGFLVLH
jgi:hypothetical protein